MIRDRRQVGVPMALWISLGVVVAVLLLIALLVDRRDRRGGAERVGRMRLPGRLARRREAKIADHVVQFERRHYEAEAEEPPKAD
jgi:hypothetical protein